MSERSTSFFQRWLATTVGVLLAAKIVDGVQADTLVTLLATSFLLGILNAFLRPVLMLLTLPLVLVTLGLFTLVINALLLLLVSHLVKGFQVVDFWAAFKGSLLISIVSFLANIMFGKKEVRTQIKTTRGPRGPKDKDTGTGPIIDV